MTAAPSLAETPVSTAPAEAAVPPGSRVYLIDGSGYIFRAFHALPPLTRPSDGLPVGAVHGFCNMLWKLLRETKGEKAPTHLAVIFDHSRASFRTEISAAYKAQRPEPPAELVPQFALIRDAVRAFSVACIEQEGYEADDIIAAYTCQAADAGAEVVVVSSGQGSDAARPPRRDHARHHEEQGDRRGGGDREIRGAAGEGRRRAGARGRFGRQRAGRAGHRHQDGGGTHPRIWRPRKPARQCAAHQAEDAARAAHRVRRPGAAVAPPRRA